MLCTAPASHGVSLRQGLLWGPLLPSNFAKTWGNIDRDVPRTKQLTCVSVGSILDNCNVSHTARLMCWYLCQVEHRKVCWHSRCSAFKPVCCEYCFAACYYEKDRKIMTTWRPMQWYTYACLWSKKGTYSQMTKSRWNELHWHRTHLPINLSVLIPSSKTNNLSNVWRVFGEQHVLICLRNLWGQWPRTSGCHIANKQSMTSQTPTR